MESIRTITAGVRPTAATRACDLELLDNGVFCVLFLVEADSSKGVRVLSGSSRRPSYRNVNSVNEALFEFLSECGEIEEPDKNCAETDDMNGT